MTHAIPPTRKPERLLAELRLVPREAKEDAVQESWVAFLAGRDPVRAVNTFTRRRRRQRRLGLAPGAMV
jgi:hypothetical protein